MDSAEAVRPAFYIAMNRRQIIGVIATGLLTGVLAWGLAVLLDTYVLRGMLCQTMMTPQCQTVPGYSRSGAVIVASIVAVFSLVKLQVFRPLLVVIGAVASIWGLGVLITDMPAYSAVGVYAAAFAVAMLTFTWLARIRSFWIAVIAMVTVAVATQYLLTT